MENMPEKETQETEQAKSPERRKLLKLLAAGGVASEFTVTRLAEDRYYLTSAAAAERRVSALSTQRQDILDAVDWVLKRYPVDEKRIYLTGTSGGGHMSMLMAGRPRALRRRASASSAVFAAAWLA